MVTIDQIAEVAIKRDDDLLLRGMTLRFLRENPYLSEIPRPKTDDLRILAAAASLLELFAQRRGQKPPQWTEEIGPIPEPMYLVKSAEKETMKFTKHLCDTQSPEPLRKRGFKATPNFLELV
jgi:hypothetical protein